MAIREWVPKAPLKTGVMELQTHHWKYHRFVGNTGSLLELETVALLRGCACVGRIWCWYRLEGYVCKCANVQGTTCWPCGCNNDILPKGMAPDFSILAMQNIFLKHDAVLFKEISLEMNSGESHIYRRNRINCKMIHWHVSKREY